MGIMAIVSLLMLRASPEDNAGAVVARLGADRYADREAAADELRQMGRRALPALRAARSESDPEIRLRASRLRDEIASALLLEPARDRPAFGQGHLPSQSKPPNVAAGPFRVELERVVREREINLEPGLGSYGVPMARRVDVRAVAPDDSPRSSMFYAELRVSVKPELWIIGEVVTSELKATDTNGRSLLPAVAVAARRAPGNPASPFGQGYFPPSPTRTIRIALDDSALTTGSTARIDGLLTIALMGRGDDPIVVPLADAGGRKIERDGIKLAIHESEVKPGQFNGELELTFETETPSDSLLVQGPGVAPTMIPRPLGPIPHEIEVIDGQGRPLNWHFLRSPPGGLRGRMRLMIPSHAPSTPLDLGEVKLRVSTFVGAAMTFPFAFDGVPMP